MGMTPEEWVRLVEALAPVLIALFGVRRAGAAQRAAREAADAAAAAHARADEVGREQIQMALRARVAGTEVVS
jgi:hypothetical protein